MDPQQPTNPVTDDDDVEGHRRTIGLQGGDDTDDVEGHRRTIGVQGGDDTDDVEGHLSGALGKKSEREG